MIRTTNLRKTYKDFEALKGIDLHVREGDVYGFIGPNGAGKTTTIRVLTTLLEPTEGGATIDGLNVWTHKEEVRGRIGYLPDNFGVYRDMTVTEYMHFFAAAYGLPTKGRQSLIMGLLELTDLSSKRHALIDNLSRGMQQRLGLARTLVHDPKVLILDEPASGLDPRARVEIREVLRELQRMGKTILLSSHILSELEEICTRVGILEQGVLVAEGTVEEIMEQAYEHDEASLRTTDDERAPAVLRELSGVLDVLPTEPGEALRVRVTRGQDLALLTKHLQERGIQIRHVSRNSLTLEDVFMKLTEGLVQ